MTRLPPRRPRLVRDHTGQASTEFVALLPLLAVIVALLWQLVLAGHATWAAGAAARAGARANALGGDPERSVRTRLPRELASGVRVRTRPDGAVHVAVRIPTLVSGLDLGRTSATAFYASQGS